jgi:hypothetical protein
MDFRQIDKIVLAVIVAILLVWGLVQWAGKRSGAPEAGPAAEAETAADYRPGQVYIAWDSVRLRSGPNRESEALMTLYRNAPVMFTGRFSRFSEEISQGGIQYREPWIEVRTANDRTGWVFGGGVRVYPSR